VHALEVAGDDVWAEEAAVGALFGHHAHLAHLGCRAPDDPHSGVPFVAGVPEEIV
jgi:hypothetical protein